MSCVNKTYLSFVSVFFFGHNFATTNWRFWLCFHFWIFFETQRFLIVKHSFIWSKMIRRCIQHRHGTRSFFGMGSKFPDAHFINPMAIKASKTKHGVQKVELTYTQKKNALSRPLLHTLVTFFFMPFLVFFKIFMLKNKWLTFSEVHKSVCLGLGCIDSNTIVHEAFHRFHPLPTGCKSCYKIVPTFDSIAVKFHLQVCAGHGCHKPFFENVGKFENFWKLSIKVRKMGFQWPPKLPPSFFDEKEKKQNFLSKYFWLGFYGKKVLKIFISWKIVFMGFGSLIGVKSLCWNFSKSLESFEYFHTFSGFVWQTHADIFGFEFQ